MIILVIKSCRKPDTAFKLNILRIGIDEKKPDKLFYYVKYVIFYIHKHKKYPNRGKF